MTLLPRGTEVEYNSITPVTDSTRPVQVLADSLCFYCVFLPVDEVSLERVLGGRDTDHSLVRALNSPDVLNYRKGPYSGTFDEIFESSVVFPSYFKTQSSESVTWYGELSVTLTRACPMVHRFYVQNKIYKSDSVDGSNLPWCYHTLRFFRHSK